MAQTFSGFSDWQVDNPATWKRSGIHHLDMHVVVRQDVSWLEVQVEQGWLKAVEELHGQAGLMDDAALEWLLRLWVGSVFSRAINSITMPRGCLHTP